MSEKTSLYWTLFRSVFQISACTFGGGFVIIPLMREKFVQDLHWIDEEEMLDLTAIAQSTPGAIAVNVSVLVGYHMAGLPGALVAALGTILPPFLILSVVSLFYAAFRANRYVNAAMTGMLAGVAAVIANVVFTMGRDLVRLKRVLPVVIMILSFVAVRFLGVNILFVLLLCALVGAADTLVRQRRRAK